MDSTEVKLLFVLSSDFGELSNAMYFLHGTSFQSLLLMPPRLLAVNEEALPVRTGQYENVDDVLRSVDEEDPDAVLLFSGYLYGVNRLLDEAPVERLVGELQGRRCRVATSDPFLNVMSGIDASTFSDRHPQKQWLTGHFSRIARALAETVHLYVIRPDGFGGSNSASYFNEQIIRLRPGAEDCERLMSGLAGFDASRKKWLFILSSEDYAGQTSMHGKDRFDEILAEKLRQTSAQGRQAVLLAPEPCINVLSGRDVRETGAVLLPFCPYDRFAGLLFGAEAVFYWNIFSSTVPIRLVNRLPFYFFDRGHMARASQPLFEVGMREYYLDSPLIYVDPLKQLDADELDRITETQEGRGMDDARRNFWRSPSPREMIRDLLAG